MLNTDTVEEEIEIINKKSARKESFQRRASRRRSSLGKLGLITRSLELASITDADEDSDSLDLVNFNPMIIGVKKVSQFQRRHSSIYRMQKIQQSLHEDIENGTDEAHH